MKVREMIEKLAGLEQDAEIVIESGSGFFYEITVGPLEGDGDLKRDMLYDLPHLGSVVYYIGHGHEQQEDNDT